MDKNEELEEFTPENHRQLERSLCFLVAVFLIFDLLLQVPSFASGTSILDVIKRILECIELSMCWLSITFLIGLRLFMSLSVKTLSDWIFLLIATLLSGYTANVVLGSKDLLTITLCSTGIQSFLMFVVFLLGKLSTKIEKSNMENMPSNSAVSRDEGERKDEISFFVCVCVAVAFASLFPASSVSTSSPLIFDLMRSMESVILGLSWLMITMLIWRSIFECFAFKTWSDWGYLLAKCLVSGYAATVALKSDNLVVTTIYSTGIQLILMFSYYVFAFVHFYFLRKR